MRALLLCICLCFSCAEKSKYNSLTEAEKDIIINKGTEPKFSGKFNDHNEEGIYTCKQCDEKLFLSEHKFNSKTGWPSFDDFISGQVKIKNPQAEYTEITCAKCNGHLGHLKKGEGFTDKNKRYCVNSLALNFIGNSSQTETVKAE